MSDGLRAFTEALLAVATTMDEVIAAINGYRAKLEAEGYPSPVIDVMVADYHRLLLDIINPTKRNAT